MTIHIAPQAADAAPAPAACLPRPPSPPPAPRRQAAAAPLALALLLALAAARPAAARPSAAAKAPTPVISQGFKSAGDDLTGDVVFSVVIDAGSTGSRVSVFRFKQDMDKKALKLLGEVFMQVRPGLSSFQDDPKGAAKSLAPLLAVAAKAVPPEVQNGTSLTLRATAGLRLINKTKSEAILSVRRRRRGGGRGRLCEATGPAAHGMPGARAPRRVQRGARHRRAAAGRWARASRPAASDLTAFTAPRPAGNLERRTAGGAVVLQDLPL
jgi:hypothetical protein